MTETTFVSSGITFKFSGELEQDDSNNALIPRTIIPIDLIFFRFFILLIN